MLIGGSKDVAFATVLGERFAFGRFVMDHRLHANRDKWVGIVVVWAVQMRVSANTCVHVCLCEQH